MNPEYRFTMTPENVLKYASFMQEHRRDEESAGVVEGAVLPNVHSLPGS